MKIVTEVFSNGEAKDITDLAQYSISDDTIASVSGTTVTVLKPCITALVVAYEDKPIWYVPINVADSVDEGL